MPKDMPERARNHNKSAQQNLNSINEFKNSAEFSSQRSAFHFFFAKSTIYHESWHQIREQKDHGQNEEQIANPEGIYNSKYETSESREPKAKMHDARDNILLKRSPTSQKADGKYVEIGKTGQQNMEQDELVDTETKRKMKKKADLRKLNAVKNFMRKFVNRMNTLETKEKLARVHRLEKSDAKKILDNLNKKIKYEKKCISLSDFQKMLRHEDQNYQKALKHQCIDFISSYPEQVKNSKIKDGQIIENLVEELKKLVNN